MEYPVSFKSDLVVKALGKGFDDFVEKYHGAKTSRHHVPPTDLQYEIAEVYKKKGIKGARKQFPKVAEHRIAQAVIRVARWEWLNN